MSWRRRCARRWRTQPDEILSPVVMGRGARLFEDATAVGRLRLVEATPFRNGVVLMTYRA